MRLLPTIRYGTGRYPEKLARRLRALNLAARILAAVLAGFAVVQFLDPTPGLWKVAAINAVSAPIYAAIPLLHRFARCGRLPSRSSPNGPRGCPRAGRQVP